MPPPEQPQPAALHRRGIAGDLYGIRAAGEEVHTELQRIRVAMVDETSNPKASRLLHAGIETGKKGGRQQGKALMTAVLKIAGKSGKEIRDLLALFDHVEKIEFGDPDSPAQPTPPSERSPHASSD